MITDERFGDVGYDFNGKRIVARPIAWFSYMPVPAALGTVMYTLSPLPLGRIYDVDRDRGCIAVFEQSLENV